MKPIPIVDIFYHTDRRRKLSAFWKTQGHLNECVNVIKSCFFAAKIIAKCAVGDDFCVANSLTYVVQHNDGELKSKVAAVHTSLQNNAIDTE